MVLSLSLYPYVYLLTRTALAERAPQLMEAARLLGAGLPRRIVQVALPLARPAITAGLALSLMETLADFGVSSYFGVQTFTAGIYKKRTQPHCYLSPLSPLFGGSKTPHPKNTAKRSRKQLCSGTRLLNPLDF